jgi:DNA-binding NarL/FixJ family response regulator
MIKVDKMRRIQSLAAPLIPFQIHSSKIAESPLQRKHTPVCCTIRVLIADDHSVLRQGLSGALNQEPDMVIVGEASNGIKALEYAQTLHPDVILMDLGMPEMDGIEATRKIHSEMPKTKVIGLSMYDEIESACAMIEAGAVAYLNKTCSIEELTTTIRRCVGQSVPPPHSKLPPKIY